MPKAANLLFILSDNHARSVVGCYGDSNALTPNINALAARGVLFANAYSASPLCCPARASLATGCYPNTTGYWDNAIVYDGRVRSWMHVLRDEGYDVVSVGKLHFRSSEDDNGFSKELLPMHIAGGKGGVSMLLRWSDEEPINVGQWELYTNESGVGETAYQAYDIAITDHAVAWLRSIGAAAERPWALFVSYVSPHPPFRVPQRLYDLYEGIDLQLPPLFRPNERSNHPVDVYLRRKMDTREILDEAGLHEIVRCYHALATHVDEQVGEVLGALGELGQLNDTRVIYSSDHGEAVGAHGLFGKSNLYETSIGVPLIMAGPDLPRASLVKEPVSHVDLFHTICESASVSFSATAHVDGESLWPIIDGASRSRPVMAEYHAAGSQNASFAVRKGAYKLIHHVGAAPQLFDVVNDPDESTNLAATDIGSVLVEALESTLRTICDPEAVNRRAKDDQRRKAEFWGGNDAIRRDGLIVYTPPPTVPGPSRNGA